MDLDRKDGAAQLRETLSQLRAFMDTVVITNEHREMEAHLERQILVYNEVAFTPPGHTEQ